MTLSRRSFLTVLGASALATRLDAMPLFKGQAKPFSPDWLRGEAQRLAALPYSPMLQVPKPWRDLNYDQYKSIWFNAAKALWSDTASPFKLDFFHPGLYFPRPVEINVVQGDTARTLGFDISLFDKTDKFPDLPIDDTMGYSGFRVRGALRQPGIFEEFMVFQGASYFRAIGTGQTYGLSARGLALNTGDQAGEEFPDFTHFWLETPEPGDQTIRIYALLNGASVTGAYSFDITHGAPAKVRVQASLFPRRDLGHVGIAPLTSMFLFDQTNRNRFDDFRPAVHDSEGLMVWNGAGELLWRPLANPRELQVSSFVDTNPRGFGLMQRARAVGDFADLEAHYHNRPSLWITPRGNWGRGSVTLVEIPSDREIYDNIVAYWRPRTALPAMAEHRFSYDMVWGGAPPRPRDVAKVLNTRIGKGFDQHKIVVTIDFADHPALRGDLDGITRFVGVNRGSVAEPVLQRNPGTGGVRLAFSFDPGAAQALEFRAQLVKDGKSLSEVWLYRWTA